MSQKKKVSMLGLDTFSILFSPSIPLRPMHDLSS